jgi:hypothetical protein
MPHYLPTAVSVMLSLGLAGRQLPAPSVAAAAAPSVAMVATEGEGRAYWSRWRGPSGQGLALGGGYPDARSATQGIRWRTPVPGRGHSSPIVWADRVFLTTAGSPLLYRDRLILYQDHRGGALVAAFDTRSGETLWRTEREATIPAPGASCGAPRATPAR